MSVTTDIQVACRSSDIPNSDDIDDWIRAAVRHVRTDPVELSVRIVDEVEINALNQQYRGKNEPTDVLAFPATLPHIRNPAILGDIVVCAGVVKQRAEELGKALDEHWALIIAHGVLHLCGYDHEQETDAQLMQSTELSILQTLGFNRVASSHPG